MPLRTELDFYTFAHEILHRMRSSNGGVLCTVINKAGADNVLTLGWGLIGPAYRSRPVFAIAVTPLRYSWRFLQEVPEFVIAVPDDALRGAADLCGTKSGRDLDKFDAAGLTRTGSRHVRAPSIVQCPINVECRVYHSIAPPHQILTPEHRARPLEQQHTIYFAEVLGTYRYR
jgi:flavin reductase (DIM6/NTAB) family NADH-FMN oxidoreductase RutF